MFESFLGVNPWTSLFVLLNTLTVFLVARHYLFAPVMHMIESRQKEIDSLYTDADTAKESAIALEEACRRKLLAADETGARIVREAVAYAQNKQEEIIRQAKAEAAVILQKADAAIAQEKRKALQEAKDEICVIAIAMAQKVVARELQDADQQRLVDDFINTLE